MQCRDPEEGAPFGLYGLALGAAKAGWRSGGRSPWVVAMNGVRALLSDEGGDWRIVDEGGVEN